MPEPAAKMVSASLSLSDRLQNLTEALAATQRQDEVLQIILHPALEALGAAAGAVLLINAARDQLDLAATQGYGEAVQVLWQAQPFDLSVPTGAVLQRREPLFFEHSGELAAAYPELAARTDAAIPHASAVLPMFLDDQPLGTLLLGFQEPHTFPFSERRFLRILAAQCALALGRARVLAELHAQTQAQQITVDALSAFIALTEAVGASTDRTLLVRHAAEVLQATLIEVVVGFYERRDESWVKQEGNTTDRETLLAARDLPPLDLARAIQTQRPVFPESSPRALGPYVQAGEPAALLVAELPGHACWTPPQQQVFTAVWRSLGRALDRAEQAQQQERQAALDAFVALTEAIGTETNVERLAHRAIGLLRAFMPQVSAVYYVPSGEVWQAQVISEDVGPDLAAVLRSGVSQEAPDFVQAIRERQAIFAARWNGAARRFHASDEYGAAAFYPYFRGDAPSGMFAIGTQQGRTWTAEERAVFGVVGRSLGLALERAEHLQQLEDERAALEAFAAFTGAVGGETREGELVQQALDVLGRQFQHSGAGYYVLEQGRWVLTAWNEGVSEVLRDAMQAGLPLETPMFAQAMETRLPVFIEAWDEVRDGVQESSDYGAGSAFPVIVGAEVWGVLTVGLKHTQRWSHRDRALVRAVFQSLSLALMRTAQARHLGAQKAEVDSRNQALEAVAQLSRELMLETDRPALVRRAQDIVAGLLPPGVYTYFELEGTWQLKAQVGDFGQPALQAVLAAGLPHDTPSLWVPYQTGQPLYQEAYTAGTDTAADLTEHIQTGATLPLMVGGKVVGSFCVALFEQRPWNPVDKAVLETIVQGLGLALERADQAGRLQAQRDALGVANEELESFAYSVSHDLRTPVRHISSFGDLLRKSLGHDLDQKSVRYLDVIQQAAKRMDALIDAMLDLSRTARQPLSLRLVDLTDIVNSVQTGLEPQLDNRRVTWEVGALPQVWGDAGLLRQVMENLLGNAVKYTARTPEAQIAVWAEEDAEHWRVFVRDNGAGFDARYAHKLFGVFQRLHRQEEFEGTGVGLANVRRVVARHGGEVQADGQVGQGATFSFTLPKTSQNES